MEKENANVSYIKTDNNKIINETHIRWVKKLNNCLEVCTKSTGCNIRNGDTHRICKLNTPDSYEKLNAHLSTF
jgi:hypothetical protein